MANNVTLTKNEKLALKILLSNSRITDSDIAAKLKISSQAVGKIRKNLERLVITSYGVNLNYPKMGIHTFAIAIAKLTTAGLDKGELEVEQILQEQGHIIDVYRLPRGSSTHIIIYGFTDINEFDHFFHAPRMRDELHRYLEVQELFTFSHNSLIKGSAVQLFHHAISKMDVGDPKIVFNELEHYKHRFA